MSIADTANSIYYNGYTYSIGDLVTLKDRKLYKDSYGPSYITVDGDFVWKISQIYPTQEVKIFVKYESGSDYYQGYSGFVYPSQIASGGTPDKYTYSFNANGGSGAPSAMTKTYGKIFTFPTKKPIREGYTFNGWYNSDVNDGEIYQAGEQVASLPNKNITWYASWKEHYLTVNYYSNYATKYNGLEEPNNNVNNNNVLIWTQRYYYSTYYKDGLNDYSSGSTLGMVRTGYSSTGNWGTSTSGGYLISQNTGITGETLAKALGKTLANGNEIVKVYAQWKINQYKLTINPNGGTWNGSTDLRSYTQDYGTSKEIESPTRIGYTFDGWELNGYGSFSDETYTYGAGNGELVAQWSRIVLKVAFDASTNGGSPNSTRNVYYGDTIGTLPVPSKTFYKFIGWFTKAVGGTQISANNVITSNVKFYAQYKIDASVKVKYNGNNIPAIVWVKVNGAWEKCITWIKDNGKWNKSTGAD